MLGWSQADQDIDDDSNLLSAMEWVDGAVIGVDDKLPDATLVRTTTRRRTTPRGSSHLVAGAGCDRDAEADADAALQATLVQLGGHDLWMNVMRSYSAAHNVFAAQPAAAEHVEAQCAAVRRWVLSAQSVDRAAPDVAQYMVRTTCRSAETSSSNAECALSQAGGPHGRWSRERGRKFTERGRACGGGRWQQTLYAREVEAYAAQLKATAAAAAATLHEADATYARFMRNPTVAHAVASYDARVPPTAARPTIAARPRATRRVATAAAEEDTEEEDDDEEEYDEEDEEDEEEVAEARRDGKKGARRSKEAKAAVVVCTGTGMSETEEEAHLQHLKSKFSPTLLKLKSQFMQRRKKGKLPTSAKAPLKAWWCVTDPLFTHTHTHTPSLLVFSGVECP